jgi:hypothetical protein
MERRAETGRVRVLVCGDVMLGRGVDAILPAPSKPVRAGSHRGRTGLREAKR